MANRGDEAGRGNERRRDDRGATKTYFRSERLYHQNGQWYFSTREAEHGPYRTREEAEWQLAKFMAGCAQLAHFQSARERKATTPSKLEARRPTADVLLNRDDLLI